MPRKHIISCLLDGAACDDMFSLGLVFLGDKLGQLTLAASVIESTPNSVSLNPVSSRSPKFSCIKSSEVAPFTL